MKAALTRFYNNLDQAIDLKRVIYLSGWILSLFITIYCLFLLSFPVYETAAPKGIVFATDNDGGRAIETSMKTRWYNSNHFAPYGNLYYRLSHTVADLVSLPENNLTEIENKEKTHNLALKIVSLLSLYGLCFFLTWVFIGFTSVTVISATAFMLLSLNIPMWSFWVFRPHPEHLLSLTLAMALFAFAKYLAKPDERKNFVISALLWGMAMAVKRSTSAFIPGIIIFLLFPFNKSNVKRSIEYIGWMLFAYLLIGFPQNFGFLKHINFLLYESSLHSLGFGTLPLNIKLIGEQLKVLLPILFVLSFFGKSNESKLDVKFLVFILLGSIPVLTRELSFPGDHHTMPIVISICIGFIFLLFKLNPVRIPRGKSLILFVLAIITIKLNGIPGIYHEKKNDQLYCRSEISQLIDLISKDISPNFTIVKDALYPSDSKIDLLKNTVWGLRWTNIKPYVGFMGVHSATMPIYQGEPPKAYSGRMTEDWDEKIKFYKDIRGVDSVTSPDGSQFKKIFSECSFDLWKRVKDVKVQ